MLPELLLLQGEEDNAPIGEWPRQRVLHSYNYRVLHLVATQNQNFNSSPRSESEVVRVDSRGLDTFGTPGGKTLLKDPVLVAHCIQAGAPNPLDAC
eukprot:5237346-Amphidinium_carterae.1